MHASRQRRPNTRGPVRTAGRLRASSRLGPPVPNSPRHPIRALRALPIGVGKQIQGLGGGARTNTFAHAAILATAVYYILVTLIKKSIIVSIKIILYKEKYKIKANDGT
ncbi:hypothetical protein NDU88_004261 [Pleurodeles waltl]|uniref:Uncharacterized protein n=1 Tax=Pleurodeles waltl TaxID=8319 RepID=A0AAV7VGJ5_PLEWA|nr:hypothetical protein NDU88_004261 [Pleurodeles waltl]